MFCKGLLSYGYVGVASAALARFDSGLGAQRFLAGFREGSIEAAMWVPGSHSGVYLDIS